MNTYGQTVDGVREIIAFRRRVARRAVVGVPCELVRSAIQSGAVHSLIGLLFLELEERSEFVVELFDRFVVRHGLDDLVRRARISFDEIWKEVTT